MKTPVIVEVARRMFKKDSFDPYKDKERDFDDNIRLILEMLSQFTDDELTANNIIKSNVDCGNCKSKPRYKITAGDIIYDIDNQYERNEVCIDGVWLSYKNVYDGFTKEITFIDYEYHRIRQMKPELGYL